jgi:hypothetical protein
MARITIIAEDVRTVDARIDGGHVLVDPTHLPDALGWELKPEGLCRDDVCVPVRDRDALMRDGEVDLVEVGDALGRPLVVDAGAGIMAMALPSEERQRALDDLVAPSFELDDLDGKAHRLEEWRGRKKLLVAFASW